MKAKVIVRHRGTRAYISCDEPQQWTDDAAQARFFETPYHALYFCVDQELQNADIVFRSREGREERFLRC